MFALKAKLLKLLSSAGKSLRRSPLSRIAILERAHAALAMWLHGSNEAQVGPFRVQFDPRDRVISKRVTLYGEYQRREIELLCSVVRPGDHVLDIGANIGIFSLYLSRAVGSGGRVIAVEPDPDNLALLRANLEANQCRNVTVVPCALGAESGSAELFQVDRNRGNLSFADIAGTGKSVRVPVRRADEILGELGVHQSTAAKVDVEGAEPAVFQGFGKSKPPIILFEFDPRLLCAQGHDPEALLESLSAEGYSLDVIHPDTGERIPAAPPRIHSLVTRINTTFNILAERRTQPPPSVT